MIAVGGSDEAGKATPGIYRITLKERKGFIRVALQSGASLVPVFAFGENDVFEQPFFQQGNIIWCIKTAVKKYLGISLPIVIGRGFLQRSQGILPRQVPITTVVGKPIYDVPLITNPSEEEIDALHKIFVESLHELFKKNKDQYCPYQNVQLVIE